MSCGQCMRAVHGALQALEGVEVQRVEGDAAYLMYDARRVSPRRLEEAVHYAGYEVRGGHLRSPGASREDVLREVEQRFPAEQRKEVLEALDLFIGECEHQRARVQLGILERSDGSTELLHALASHRRMMSGEVAPPPDRVTRKNERYAG